MCYALITALIRRSIHLNQGSAKCGPRANCGPNNPKMRPAGSPPVNTEVRPGRLCQQHFLSARILFLSKLVTELKFLMRAGFCCAVIG